MTMESLPQKRVRWANGAVEVNVDVDVAVKVPVRVRVPAVVVAILASPVIIGTLGVAAFFLRRRAATHLLEHSKVRPQL
jgi:hypothetical protein